MSARHHFAPSLYHANVQGACLEVVVHRMHLPRQFSHKHNSTKKPIARFTFMQLLSGQNKAGLQCRYSDRVRVAEVLVVFERFEMCFQTACARRIIKGPETWFSMHAWLWRARTGFEKRGNVEA